MKRRLFGSLFAVGLLACGSRTTTKSQTTTARVQPAPPAEQQGMQCPMKEMAGAEPTVTDTSDGVAISFTTEGDVSALRAQVHQMADMHNRMHQGGGMQEGMANGGMHEGMGHGDMHGTQGMQGMQDMQMMASRATVEDIAHGARIVLVPDDPSQVAALRSHAREHAAMMGRGECPMMGPQRG